MIPYLSLKKMNALHADEIRRAADEVVGSGWYLQGEATRRFEAHYARFTGTPHCVGCGNGFDALWLIFRAYKVLGVLREGDEVIVPANTYIASILALSDNGLVPVLVEPDPDTLLMDDRLVEAHITSRTRAVLIVHLYGRCAMSPRIASLCRKHHLKLVEDNAQAHGCRYVSGGMAAAPRTGSLGDAAAHSFYPGKNLGALGDAGAVTTADGRLAAVVRALGNYGSSRKYVFPYQGRNSRIDEIQAAVLDVKLRYLDDENARRREIADFYLRHVDNPRITLPRPHGDGEAWTNRQDNVFHIFPVLCPQREKLQAHLAQEGVGTMIHYPIPPHKQECYKEWNTRSLPLTERISREELSIPCNPTLTADEVEHVADALNRF